MGLLKKIKKRVSNVEVIEVNGDEYENPSGATFDRENLPGEVTVVVKYHSILGQSGQTYLELRDGTAIIPKLWEDTEQGVQLQSLLTQEGYDIEFEQVVGT